MLAIFLDILRKKHSNDIIKNASITSESHSSQTVTMVVLLLTAHAVPLEKV